MTTEILIDTNQKQTVEPVPITTEILIDTNQKQTVKPVSITTSILKAIKPLETHRSKPYFEIT